MIQTNNIVTKTRFVQGCRCPKLAWHAEHQPELLEANEATLEQGIAVGELARSLYKEGILVPLNDAENKTKELLKENKPLFEATFRYGHYLCRTDILVPNEDGWDVLEVKSSTEIKPDHESDLSFQVTVLKAAGIKVKDAYIVHLNNEFRKQGPIDINLLFTKAQITPRDTAEEAEKLRQTLENKKSPTVPIGPYCNTQNKRQDCPMKKTCWKYLPEHNVMQFYYDKKLGFSLLEKGAERMEDVSDAALKKDAHFIQRDAAITGRTFRKKEAIKDFLNKWDFPLYFFDFETIGPAIPVHEGAKPYQAIPFQFSLHVMQEDGSLTHYEFLAENEEPRPSLLHALELLKDKGSIVTYNAKFERGVLLDLKEAYPEYALRIDAIINRIVDLLEVFQNFWYYHPKQKGSCSIKYVLPALTNLSYADMDIGNGADASSEYFRVMYQEQEAPDKQSVLEALRKYCELDTLAMVEIYRVLKSESE